MHTKGRFSVNHHTGELVGISKDEFELSVVIEREFKELTANIEDENEDVEVLSVPQPTKKFIVFIATTINAKKEKQHIVVARYNLSNVTTDFMARRLNEIPATLFDYGFVVTNCGNDGATELRAATHLLATMCEMFLLVYIQMMNSMVYLLTLQLPTNTRAKDVKTSRYSLPVICRTG
jgi:hypothetical protein